MARDSRMGSSGQRRGRVSAYCRVTASWQASTAPRAMSDVVTIGICVAATDDSAIGEDLAIGQAWRAGDRAAAKALDADRQEVARQIALDQHRGATAAHQIAGAGAAEHRHRHRPERSAGRRYPARSLEEPFQPRPLLWLNDRRVPGLLALAEGRVLAQALRLLLRDRPRSRAAAACARTAACRQDPATAGRGPPPGPPRCGSPAPPAGRPPGPAPAVRGCWPPAGRREPSAAPAPASALARSDCSCGRIAPGRGGGRAKLGGMASGARVVTVNSSGASRMKPRLWPRLSPPQPARPAAPAASTRPVATRLIKGGIGATI